MNNYYDKQDYPSEEILDLVEEYITTNKNVVLAREIKDGVKDIREFIKEKLLYYYNFHKGEDLLLGFNVYEKVDKTFKKGLEFLINNELNKDFQKATICDQWYPIFAELTESGVNFSDMLLKENYLCTDFLIYWKIWINKLQGEERKEVLERIAASTGDDSVYADLDFYIENLSSDELSLFIRNLHLGGNKLLHLMKHYYSLENDEMSNIKRKWERIEKPIKSSKIISIDREENQPDWTCLNAEGYHLNTFLKENEAMSFMGEKYRELYKSWAHGKCVLIKLDGTIVGSFKRLGVNSMIGLKNVVKNDGSFDIMVGGLYRVSNELSKYLIDASYSQGLFAEVEVRELPLSYLRMSFIREETFNNDFNFEQIARTFLKRKKDF